MVPTSLEEALAALARYPDALVLAGGTDVMVEVNMGHRRVPQGPRTVASAAVDGSADAALGGSVDGAVDGPAECWVGAGADRAVRGGTSSDTSSHTGDGDMDNATNSGVGSATDPAVVDVVAVGRLGELRRWWHDPVRASVHVGAGITYEEMMEPPLADLVPALAQASRTVGSPQIRAVGTLGGNLGTCSPAGDALPVLAALDATVHLRSAAGERALPVAHYMVGPKRTARLPGELVTGVTLPVLAGWQGYSKVGARNAMVIATATACLAVDPAPGAATPVRLAVGSVGPTVLRCADAEAFAAEASARGDLDIAALRADDAVVARFGALAAAASRPIDDHRSTAAYRRHAVEVMARRLLRRAFPER